MSESRVNFMCPFYMTCGEICDVVSDDFLKGAKLLDEYSSLVQSGQNPDKKSFIDRCPETQKEGFEDLLKVSDFLIDHYKSSVSEETVDKAIEAINRIREKKMTEDKSCRLCDGIACRRSLGFDKLLGTVAGECLAHDHMHFKPKSCKSCLHQLGCEAGIMAWKPEMCTSKRHYLWRPKDD